MPQALEAVRLFAGLNLDLRGESDYALQRLRAMPLGCFSGSLLYEVQAWLPGQNRAGLMNLVHAPMGLVLLDGTSSPFGLLRQLRQTGDAASALQYAELFCSAVHGDEGRFRIVHSSGDFALDGGSIPDTLAAAITPPEAERSQPDDAWEIRAVVHYSGYLFRSRFTLADGQTLEMVEDTILDAEARFFGEQWHRQFRLPGAVEKAGAQ